MSDQQDGLSAWREPSRRSTACAAGVLESGRESPSIVTILTDEQLLALEGLSAVQPTVLPYADQHLADSHDREVAARTALRDLMARRDVLAEVEMAELEERDVDPDNALGFAASPKIAGALLLRRAAQRLGVFERTVSEQVHHLYYYPCPGDVVLEEEVTADGMHLMTIMPRTAVAQRARYLIDQWSVAGVDGEATEVSVDALESDPVLGERLADSRAVTVATGVDRVQGSVQICTFHMTSEEVIAGDPSEDGTSITMVPVSAAAIDELVMEIIGKAAE